MSRRTSLWGLWRRRVRRLLILSVCALLAVHVVAGIMLVALNWIDPPLTALQLQRRLEAMIADTPLASRHAPVKLSSISPHLQHAVVAAEDGRFYQHAGIDWRELETVVAERLDGGGKPRGASTLTQQLVKNLFFGTRARWASKGFELTLAPLADAVLSKERILELYLNQVEWGNGVYGIEAASRHYYGIPAAALDREQSARLAACLPSPRRRHPGQMDRTSALILSRMAGHGW